MAVSETPEHRAGSHLGRPGGHRWYRAIDARPAVARARAVGKDHTFKKEVDEETRRALFPSNYPRSPVRTSEQLSSELSSEVR